MSKYIDISSVRPEKVYLSVFMEEPVLMYDKDKIDKIPAADVVPVVHAHWVMNSNIPDTIICSKCNVGFDAWKHEQKYFNYCPNCGVKMDGEAGEKNSNRN